MRVAILISDLTAKGGAPRQAMLLAHWLEKLGHDSTLYASRYCPEDCFPEIGLALDIRAIEILSSAQVRGRNRGRHHGLASGAKRHLWESRQLAKLVKGPYDILNPHVRGATRAAVACKHRTGTPVVWMCDDARNWEERGYRPHYSQLLQVMFDRAMSWMERPLVREIDHVVALDHRVKTILQKHYSRPVEVIRSGLDATGFHRRPETRHEIRARHGYTENDFVLLWLGIIEPHRRLEDALAGLRALRTQGRRNVHILIAGSPAFAPAYVRKLQKLMAWCELQNCVQFHLVAVPENEMAAYYSAADALLYLAENQCWSLGVFEALACELPVIVSRACGAHEVLEDRQTAMLVSPRDSSDFVSAVTELMDQPALRQKLARQANAQVLAHITWESYARNMLRTFEQVRAKKDQHVPAAGHEVFA